MGILSEIKHKKTDAVSDQKNGGFSKGECSSCDVDKIIAKTEDLGKEKHVPVINVNANKVYVRIGSIEHPMTEDHYIEWIELKTDKGRYVKELKPGDKAAADFLIENDEHVKTVFAFCNIHGLWKKEMPSHIASGCMGRNEDWYSTR